MNRAKYREGISLAWCQVPSPLCGPQCSDEKERLSVTKLLARMFSDKNSDLAAQNPLLWNCFLGR